MSKYGTYRTARVGNILLTYTWTDTDQGAPTPTMLVSKGRRSAAAVITLADMYKYDNAEARNRYLWSKGKEFAGKMGESHSRRAAFAYCEAILHGLSDIFRMPPAPTVSQADSLHGEARRIILPYIQEIRNDRV